ncbi:NADH-quinone oxidoreductase subunit A [Conchiformibius kuhniae]|uniref:NADH-quinone oxidoreductase subunit A n=1 Tax=Conchiformibius kuhniae TaxID=211502 RepID=A0ABD8B6S7_9NEIS|nr:NADH-quinone oxidoreductase subunit A [Conchiformibius kuhniae]
MLANYFPVLVFLIVGLAAGILFITLGNVLGPKRHYAEKDTPFECGFEAFENARMKFDVRYYLVAILFILFDLEVAFMIPWAVVFKDLMAETGAYAFWSMFVFIVILTVGFVYEWKKGALEWE